MVWHPHEWTLPGGVFRTPPGSPPLDINYLPRMLVCDPRISTHSGGHSLVYYLIAASVSKEPQGVGPFSGKLFYFGAHRSPLSCGHSALRLAHSCITLCVKSRMCKPEVQHVTRIVAWMDVDYSEHSCHTSVAAESLSRLQLHADMC